LKLEDKKSIVKALNERLGRIQVAILTDYKGLDVTAINDLRRKLREENVEYQVVKNTLLLRASEGTDVALLKDYFVGPSAVALSYEDPVAPAKVLTQFAKDHQALEIKAGVMEGKVLDLATLRNLADLPSREVLLGQLVGVLNNVPTSFVRLVAEIPRQMLNVLTAIKDQKEAA
jgi:large subunit ribosomal protein L10